MPSRCVTVSGFKLQLRTQTNTIWAKGDAGPITMRSIGTEPHTDVCMSSQSDAGQVLMPPHV